MKKIFAILFICLSNLVINNVSPAAILTVGPGGTHPTIVLAYNAAVGGDIIEILTAYTGETTPIILAIRPGVSAATPITIRPALNNPGEEVPATVLTDYVFRFTTAEFVVLDGRPGSDPLSTQPNWLKVSNAGAATNGNGGAVGFFGADNCTVQFINATGPPAPTATGARMINLSGATGNPSSNNLIDNNFTTSGLRGIQDFGLNATTINLLNRILRNDITQYFAIGILTSNHDGLLVQSNKVHYTSAITTVATFLVGIQVQGNTATIDQNEIYNLTSSNATSFLHMANFGINNTFTRNDLHDPLPLGATTLLSGMQFSGSGTTTFSQNEIRNFALNASAVTGSLIFGLNFAANGTALDVTNVTRNKITNFSSPVNSIIRGMSVFPFNGSTVNIINNFVSITDANALSDDVNGIILGPAAALPANSSYTANIYYNSVRLGGAAAGTVTDASSIGIGQFMTGALSVLNMFNNVVRNDRTGGTGLNISHIGTYLNPVSGMNINVDYNTVFATGPNGFPAGFRSTLYNNNNVDEQEYRDSVASYNIRDANFNVNNSELHTAFTAVEFVSNKDLHLIPGSVGGDMNALPVPLVTTIDIDGETRSATFPYRGADEISSPMKVLSLGFALEAITNPPTSAADVITVELRNRTTCALIASSTATLPAASGNTAMVAFGDLVANGQTFLIRVIHRNTISVWSPLASPAPVLSFTSGLLSYDFTTGPDKAYTDGSLPPLKLVGTEWSAYTGDVNQDGIVDASDLSAIDNFANGPFAFDPGYARTDLNFDIAVDATDLSLADNNSFLNVIEQAPCVPIASAPGIKRALETDINKSTDKKSVLNSLNIEFNN